MRGGHVSVKQREHARALLASVGLANAMDKRPAELSGGGDASSIEKEVVIPNVVLDKNTSDADLQKYTYVAS